MARTVLQLSPLPSPRLSGAHRGPKTSRPVDAAAKSDCLASPWRSSAGIAGRGSRMPGCQRAWADGPMAGHAASEVTWPVAADAPLGEVLRDM